MNKNQMFELISKKSGKKVKEIEDFFKVFNDVLIDALCKGEKVNIAGFGSFCIKDRASTKKINPITKRFYFTKAKKVTCFKPYKKLKLCVN